MTQRVIVDLDALRHNLALVRRAVGPHTEIIASVKANAYGHGLKHAARCLEEAGVHWLALGSPEEALALRAWGISCRILLFPTIAGSHATALVDAGVTIGLQSYADAECLARIAKTPVSVFLKVDSGLGRVGIPVGDTPSVGHRIMSHLPSLIVEGLFTHLPFSNPESLPWVQGRLKAFGEAVAATRQYTNTPLLIQALASTGIACGLVAPEANAVCPGQLLFGIEPAWATSVTGKPSFGSKPVLKEIRTVLGSLRSIPAGTRFGVGGTIISSCETSLGVLPIGYSNSILVQKKGQIARVLGCPAPIVSVSLEHAVVDVTGIPAVTEGSPVGLLAEHSDMGAPLDQLARTQGRSPLEVLVALTGRAEYEYRGVGGASQAEPTEI